MPTPVSLYRYDLTGGMARSMSPMLLGRQIEGIWHTSVVVFGHEFFFDGGVGIARVASPGHTRFGAPYRTELLGHTSRTESEFMAWVMQRQRDGFGPNDYNLLQNNCNDFSQAAARFLLNQDIPSDVRDMIPSLLSTPLGQMIRPTLEQASGAMSGTHNASRNSSGNTTASAPPPPPASTSPAEQEGVGAGLQNAQVGLSEDQEDDLILARTMLESNELLDDGHNSAGVRATLTAVETLKTVLSNVLAHPADAKYRALSVASKTYTEKLKPLEEFGVCEVLEIAGFRRQTVPAAAAASTSSGAAASQVKWVLADKDGSRGVLEAIIAALEDVASNVETAAAVAQSLKDANEEHSPLPQQSTATATGTGVTEERSTARQASHKVPSTASQREKQPEGVPKNGQQLNMQSSPGDDADLLQYCSPPFPAEFTPLEVGHEGGTPFFSIYVSATSLMSSLMNRDAQGCYGKCALSSDQKHLAAYYCSRDGKEKGVSSGYKVLCVRKAAVGQQGSGTDPVMWIPASLLTNARYNPDRVDAATFLFQANGTRFGIARAPVGSGVHVGCREPSGRCVVPYGGRAENVTDIAEVLCLRARVPPALAKRVDQLAVGDALLSDMAQGEGVPFGSFTALLAWDSSRAFAQHTSWVTAAPVAPLHFRKQPYGHDPQRPDARVPSATIASVLASPTASGQGVGSGGTPPQPRLLVCHDMAGGYPQSDRPTFFLKAKTSAEGYEETVLDKVYTISYWNLMDVFVYFSHHRVTVPPRAWTEAAHRNGVPALGTIITEGQGGLEDLRVMLTDARVMGKVIQRLAELCEFYCFDGYLVNIENRVDATLAKRLVLFTDALRKRVKGVCPHGQVIWYDAVTIDGSLRYQNALTAHNKPFFDVSDGIFTNYFWNPMHLALTKAAAANRPADVFVGVDVFGRNQFGGGCYNTNVATHEAVRSGLSVALFAPGWTCECEAHGRRDAFLRAECQLWSRMQTDFKQRAMACQLRPPQSAAAGSGDNISNRVDARVATALWTTFATGVGTQFFVNGSKVVGREDATGYCQPSVAHHLPPFQYEAQGPQHMGTGAAANAAPTQEWTVRLPLQAGGGHVHGGYAPAKWRTDTAWFGDQSLAITVPPTGAVTIADWCITGLAGADHATGQASLAESHDVVVDVALLEEPGSSGGQSVGTALGLRASVALRRSGGGQGEGCVFKPKLLLCTAKDAAEVAAGGGCSATAKTSPSSPADAVWRVLRFNLSAAVARSHTATTNRDGSTATSLVSEFLEEVNAVSLLNTSGSASLRCTVGGLAVHMVPKESCAGGQEAVSPLFTRSVGASWAPFTLHPTSRGAENVLELREADAVVKSASTLPGGGDGRDVSVAVVAHVKASFDGCGGNEEKSGEVQRTFLGVHRIAPDAKSLFVRLNTSRPPTTVEVVRVEYAIVASGY